MLDSVAVGGGLVYVPPQAEYKGRLTTTHLEVDISA